MVSGLKAFVVLFPYRGPGVVQPSVTAVTCLDWFDSDLSHGDLSWVALDGANSG